jgi:hypothetical protein
MVMPGETLLTGAPATCKDCGVELGLKVLRSAAGYYIGSQCYCGPYSRESGYYKTREEAEKDLASGDFGR